MASQHLRWAGGHHFSCKKKMVCLVVGTCGFLKMFCFSPFVVSHVFFLRDRKDIFLPCCHGKFAIWRDLLLLWSSCCTVTIGAIGCSLCFGSELQRKVCQERVEVTACSNSDSSYLWIQRQVVSTKLVWESFSRPRHFKRM